ncbi:MAG: c-type cytochrome [Longimicrobiales bacterium]
MRLLCGLFLTAGLLLVGCQGGSVPAEAGAPTPAAAPEEEAAAEASEPSTLDGIYTPAQAVRGLQVFQNTCSECHAIEDWQDEYFLARWEGESVFQFWYYIYEQMPNGSPPYSLPREDVSDVLTYILELNGLPPGDVELGSDDDSIDQHWLNWGVAAPPR